MSEASLQRACPVCDSRCAAPHWRKAELRIVRCTDCGMIYANPVPTRMATGEFYDAAGTDYYLAPAKLESDYAAVRFERELRLFRKFCARGAVLDVGCSSGAFLYQLQQRWPGQYETLGTDASGPPLDYAESRGVAVVRGNFLAQPLGGRTFHAVTFWAVLEHLAEPKRFLEQAHAALKSGGLCFVLVPNLHSLAARLLGARYRYVYEQHLNYFCPQSLTRLAESGFEIVTIRCSHFNPVVIWQDWRGGGRAVSNVERGELLKRTTAYKQKAWLKPVKWVYGLAEKFLAAFGLADNLVLVLRKTEPPRRKDSI